MGGEGLKTMSDKKAAVLIDNYYLKKEVLDHRRGNSGEFKLDYEKFSEKLCEKLNSERYRTYVYDCDVGSNENFLKILERLPLFELRKGEIQRTDHSIRQKQVDIYLAVDMIKLASKNRVENIILVTGDTDFIPAIKYVKDEGAMVTLFTAKKDSFRELSATCDRTYALDDEFLIEYRANFSHETGNRKEDYQKKYYRKEYQNRRNY
jgi:uncharacterized LabA/DUF88 family protein